ncbi:MAG: methyltransferase domain-containing protein [Gemmataceae bacterium]
MHNCRVCGRIGVREHLDFGPQAIRNRFLRSSGELEFTHPLCLGYCGLCGVVQLTDPPPVEEVRPCFDWISYNEPERHLDELVQSLVQLPGITPNSSVAGLTYKDDSTLARLNRLGFANTWRPDLRADLGIESPNAGIESVQQKLRPEHATSLIAKFGRPDMLIVRHVLEHTHDTRAALAWAARLVEPGGYVIFEVPDAVRALDRLDYTTVWEEHTLYFTPVTLRACLGLPGFDVLSVETYTYTLENSLVVIARAGDAQHRTVANDVGGMARADRFVSEFQRVRERIRRRLRGRGRVAMLGAGHLTGAFINLYGLADQIEFVADDNPNKQGLFMPGSRLPILPSSELVKRDIDLCLMTVRPEIEDAVVARNAEFTARGGVLASVFPDSPYSLEQSTRTHGVIVC